MEHDKSVKIGIIGGGPAGCICAYFLKDKFKVTVFDNEKPLKTLLPTGGGRCNLAHNDFDIKTLASNYPRGEKFLYSVFSKFSTSDTIDLFEKLGVKTYIQEDGRIFPQSNSSKDVREKILSALKCGKFPTEFRMEKVIKLSKNNNFKVKTDLSEYEFDYVIIAIGGHANYEILKSFNIKIIPPRPALTALVTEKDFSALSGVSIKNVFSDDYGYGDILFTHTGISGPLIYKISSVNARKNLPYTINLSFCDIENFQEVLNKNSQKNIENVISDYIPKSFAQYILNLINIPYNMKCHKINGKMRDEILLNLNSFEIKVTGSVKDGEVVTSGGIDLCEINSKSMEFKRVKNLYAIGEVLDIDGFCGGYNLQNCWSGAFICANDIINK